MKKDRRNIFCRVGLGFLIIFLMVVMMTPKAPARESVKNMTLNQIERDYKKSTDDPRPYLKEGFYKKVLSPEFYHKLTYDIETMKNFWADVVGFKSPEVTGKIAPEIKPGKYTYKDKEKSPGLKELMIPEHYKRFNPSAPPFAGNFPEATIVPTQQYYYKIPVAEATKKNVGRTKLDAQGYIINESYVAGYPFPRPSGEFKAQQIMYNYYKRYHNWENTLLIGGGCGYTKTLKQDNEVSTKIFYARTHGRVQMEPLGWLDERARANQEDRASLARFFTPRELFGNIIYSGYYIDPERYNQSLLYISALRRVRKLSATDTQDTFGGTDSILDDQEGLSQKLSPHVYPYKYELIAEREFLVPVTTDGSVYVSSKDMGFYNVQLERRPCYVVKLTQLDKNYVYSYRILYLDKETFLLRFMESYDWKGRLYRTGDMLYGFIPEMGTIIDRFFLAKDHRDLHSTIGITFELPVPVLTRADIDLGSMIIKTTK